MTTQTIIGIAAAGVAAFTSAIGVYIRFSNEVGLLKLRVHHLEKQAAQSESRINEHDDKIHAMLLELKNDISSLKLLIEQRFNSHPQ